MLPRRKIDWKQITPTQFVVLVYLVAVALATAMLLMPFSRKPDVQLSVIDALFTATSGVTVTGLTVVNPAETFTVIGHIVLMICFQIGGIGIMALGTFLWLLFGRNISLSYRKLIMVDQNRDSLSGLVRLIRNLIVLALLIETVGTLIFSIYFYVSGAYPDWQEAIYYGLFHSISAYTNAGFDIFGNSLADFSHDYFVQFITMILIVLGAIGFPVLIELKEYLFGRRKAFRFSLFTKITSLMFLVLIAAGTIGIWLVEHSTHFAHMSWYEAWFSSLFNSVTARSGGLSTMDVNELGNTSKYVLSMLMFIGASPSSAGGGIRTTTFALILLTLATYAAGKSEVRIFRRSIKQEDIIKSFVVFAAATILVSTSVVILDYVEDEQELIRIMFEVMSAFGTCGLSTGITPGLTAPGKLVIMALMFFGRIGMLSFLFMFQKKRRKDAFHYPEEELIIG